MIVIYIGIFAYGLFCLVRPDYLVKRKNKKENQRGNQQENKQDGEVNPKDIRFYRIFGLVLMVLMAGTLAIDLLF